jgi:ATP-dependent DNA ligase
MGGRFRVLFYSVSLLLGARYRYGCKYVGRVGTGFQHDVARSLKKQFYELKPKLPPVKVPAKNLSLTAPAIVAKSSTAGGRMTKSCGTRHSRNYAIPMIPPMFTRCGIRLRQDFRPLGL